MILDILKPYNMNEQHFNILRILRGRHPELACPGDIKDVLINKRGDLTRLLDKLVKMEYVHRNQNPENRRKIDVGITEKGLEFLTFMDDKFTYMKDLKDRFTEEEAKIMNEIFDKLRG
jgi:DNA-binding MarR family transcriptional regulator